MSAKGLLARFRFSAVNGLVCFLMPASSCIGQQQRITTDGLNSPLKQFLQKELTDPRFGADKTTRYSSAVIRSDGATGEDIVIYVSGNDWCGSGGCRLLILEPDGASFKVIGQETITRPPIRVLRTKSHGHFDIGVWVEGGGIRPGYEAQLRFDGKSYPDNPSVTPARRLPEGVAGTVLISSENSGKLLY